jgi:hypothetical protein
MRYVRRSNLVGGHSRTLAHLNEASPGTPSNGQAWDKIVAIRSLTPS